MMTKYFNIIAKLCGDQTSTPFDRTVMVLLDAIRRGTWTRGQFTVYLCLLITIFPSKERNNTGTTSSLNVHFT